MRVSCAVKNIAPPKYSINNISIESVSSYKYLGIYISHNLTWNTHTNYIYNNVSRMLGFLRRNFSLGTPAVKSLLYKSLVRPKLEYACSIFDPSAVYLDNTLESTQNRATRFIFCNYSRHASVSMMKLTLGLPHLELRRKYFRLRPFSKDLLL